MAHLCGVPCAWFGHGIFSHARAMSERVSARLLLTSEGPHHRLKASVSLKQGRVCSLKVSRQRSAYSALFVFVRVCALYLLLESGEGGLAPSVRQLLCLSGMI